MFIRQALNPTLSRAFAQRVAAAYNVAPITPLVDTPIVHLWKTPAFAPTIDSAGDDFSAEEADFTDYVAQALTIEVPSTMGPNATGGSGNVTFHVEEVGVVAGNTVYGYWIQDDNGIVAFEAFPDGQEVPMALNGDTLYLVVALPIPFAYEGFIE